MLQGKPGQLWRVVSRIVKRNLPLKVPVFLGLEDSPMNHQKGILFLCELPDHEVFFWCRLKELEKGFVLDAVALSKHANDEIGRTQPSLNMGIPQYNALKDPNCKTYFKMKGLPKLAKQGQQEVSQGEDDTEITSSMMGAVFDHFVQSSSAKYYLKERESMGSGIPNNLCTADSMYTLQSLVCSWYA